MALLEKIYGIPLTDIQNGAKIPASSFWGTLREIVNGEITQLQAVSFWSNDLDGEWDSEDTTELAWLITQHDSATDKTKWFLDMLAILQAVEKGAPGYTNNADIIARIQRI